MMCDYGNEISELLAEGWDYDEAVEWCRFVNGEADENDEEKEFYIDLLMEQQEQM